MKRHEIITGGLYCNGVETRKVISIGPYWKGSACRVIYRNVSGPRKHEEHDILLTTFCRFAQFRSLCTETKFMEPPR